MPIFDYFDDFFIQAWVPFTNSFGDVEHHFTDSVPIQGCFAQISSDSSRSFDPASASTKVRFISSDPSLLHEGVVLKRSRDNLFLKIIGKPEAPPSNALSKPFVMLAEVISQL